MAKVSKASNKAKFQTGDIPTESDFIDLIDSSVNWADEVDANTSLAGDSDLKVPTQKAVKAYVDANVGGASDLDDLTDVTLTSPTNDDFLQRKSGVFVNRSIAQVKTDLGVNNLDNTSDADKPVSTLQAAADAAILTTIRGGVVAAGDDLAKLYALIQTLNSIVGGTTPDGDSVVDTVAEILAIFSTYPEGVDVATALEGKINTSLIVNTLTEVTTGKVLDATQGKALKDLIDALTTTVSGKADLASPTFTGTPLAPTASGGTNTTQLATTAFVQTELGAVGATSKIYAHQNFK